MLSCHPWQKASEKSFFSKYNFSTRDVCFQLANTKMAVLVWMPINLLVYVTQWIIPPEQVTNPPAICNPLTTSDDCSTNLLSTDLFYEPISSQLNVDLRQKSHTREKPNVCPQFSSSKPWYARKDAC